MSPLISRSGAKSSKGFGQFVSVATVPDAPIIGTVSRVDDDTVDVEFTEPSNNGSIITGYTVEGRRVSNAAALNVTAVNAADVTSPVRYDATGVVEGVDYEFRIAAINSEGTSAYSDWSNDVEMNPFDPPSAPVGVSASVTSTTNVSISWTSLNQGDAAATSSTIVSTPNISLTYTTSDVTSPISVTGTYALNTSYTFSLRFTNTYGLGASASSNAVTPNPRKLCTSFQISLGCCVSTTVCGAEGAGANCTTIAGTFNPC